MNTFSKNALSVLLCFSFVFASTAQVRSTRDSIIQAYEQRSIMLQNYSYIINGERKRYGFFNSKIGEELKSSPMAFKEFQESQKSMWVGVGLIALGTLLSYGGIVMYRNDKNSSQWKGFYFSGLGSLFLSIFYSLKSKNQLNRSIWLYNRDVLKD